MIQSPVGYYRRARGRQALSEAQALAQAGQVEKAAAAFDLAAGLASDDQGLRKTALLSAFDLYGQLGQASEAADRAEQLAHLAPNDPEAVLRLAMAREAAGRRKDAIDAWVRRLELVPGDETAHRRLADLREDDDALPHLRWLARHVPDDRPTLRRLLGLAPTEPETLARLIALSQSPEEIAALAADLDQAAAAAPASAELKLALARTRLRLAAEPAEAARRQRDIAALLPGDADSWRAAARALAADAQDQDAAAEAWAHLLTLAPYDREAHDVLGAYHMAAGRPAEALPHLRFTATAARSGKALRRVALAEEAAGEPAAAAASWGRLLETTPDDSQALRRLAALRLAVGDSAGAIDLWRQALAHTPDDVAVWRVMAAAETARGDEAAAFAALLNAHAAAPDRPAILRDLLKAVRDLGEVDTLLPPLRLAMELQPGRADLPRLLARALLDMGRADHAAEVFEQVLECEPADVEANRFLGMRAYDLGRRAEAERHLAIIAPLAPDDVKLWRRLVWCRRNSDNEDGEIEALQHLLDLTPDDEEVLARLVEMLVSARRRVEAEPLLVRLAAVRPDEVRTRVWLARARSQGGDAAGALEAWRAVLVLNPAEPEANTAIGEALLAAGDIAGAADHFAAAAPSAPKPTPVWARVAQLRRDVGDKAGEIAALQKVVSFAATINMTAHRRLADLLGAEGRHGEAVVSLELLVDAHPDNAGLVRRLAVAHQANNDAKGEAQAWTKRIALSPTDAEARLRLARLALDAGAAGEAAGHLAALPDAQIPAALGTETARALSAAGETDAERAAWSRVAAIDPTSLEAHERLAELLTAAGEGAAAEPHLQAVLAARPDDALARERLALILAGWNRKDEAARHLAHAARLRPDDARLWKRWARLAADIGDLTVATEAWRQVLTLGDDEAEARENLARLLQRQGRLDEAATYLRGLTGPAAEGLTRVEQRAAALGGLHDLLARAELKVFDVGARGGPLDWMTVMAPFAHYFACEPEAEEADRLALSLMEGDPWRGITLVREGLGKTAGEVTLHITEHSGFCSVYPPNPEMAARYDLSDALRVVGTAQIPVIPLAEAARRYGFEDLGFLKIDTQGSELDILKSGEALLKDHVQAVYLEAEFREFYKGQPLFSDIDRYLRGLGFELVRMDPVSRRRITRQAPAYSRHELIWAHALFIKRPPDPKKLAPEVFLRRVLQQMVVALACEHYDWLVDLATSPAVQAALAAEGLVFDKADLDRYIDQGLAQSLVRGFEDKWPGQVKSVPKSYIL